jgi:predicted nuclease of restriction endonuclease-like (RecB) superfamily
MTALAEYAELLKEVKARIQAAQYRAALGANAEMIRLYWDIGHMLSQRQAEEGWGAAVIPKLSLDIRNEMSEVKGFSERNLKRMLAFFRAYPDAGEFVPQPVAQMPAPLANKVPQPVAQIASKAPTTLAARKTSAADALIWQVPWGHHAVLLERVKPLPIRLWYMTQTLAQGWGRDTLALMIDSKAHARQGATTSNFALTLPPPQSELVQQTLKDPYLFDFVTLTEPFQERELETGLVRHLEKFLLELGQGFAFLGRQHRITVADQDFYIDLLFFHVRLRCYVVIELKRGEFKPEYAGKMNFYCNLVDDQLRHADDAPTIGLILCQRNNEVLAEYALRGVDKPIGVSTFELTRALPSTLTSALPSIEAIEAELSRAGE